MFQHNLFAANVMCLIEVCLPSHYQVFLHCLLIVLPFYEESEMLFFCRFLTLFIVSKTSLFLNILSKHIMSKQKTKISAADDAEI